MRWWQWIGIISVAFLLTAGIVLLCLIQVAPVSASGGPFIFSIEPSTVLDDRDTDVTIQGTNFFTPTVILASTTGMTQTLEIKDVISVCITAIVRAGLEPGHYDVTVTTDGGSATSPRALQILSTPEIENVEPPKLANDQARDLTISGSDFLTPTVIITNMESGVATELEVSASTSQAIVATVPAEMKPGHYDVGVTNYDGGLAIKSKVLQILSTPEIEKVEPDWFLNTQDTQITILGSDLQPDPTVRVVGVGVLSSTYLNETLLTAIVPGGLAVGKYNVEVTNPDGQKAPLLNDAFEVAAPTPTPTVTPQPTSTRTPTSTPVPTPTPFKRPLLFISSYSNNPSSVAPEESVVVTLKVKNIGDTSAENIRVTFVSAVFVPKGTSGTQAVSRLGSGSQTTVNQSLTLSGEASTGIHQQQVILEYEDPNGVAYSSTEVVGISVTVPEPGLPQIIIRDARTIPDPIVSGQPFSLTFTLHNVGDGMAKDVLVSVGGSGPAMPVTAGSTQSAGMLGDQGMKEVSQWLIVSDSTQKGSYSQAISIQYRDEEGNSYTTEQRVGLTVAELEEEEPTPRPRLTIVSYRSEPSFLIPGELFNLFVDLLNVGEAPAKDIRLALGSGKLVEDMSEGGTGPGLAPFAPLDTSNVKFIPYLEAQERTTVVQRMIVDGNAHSGVYALEVTFSYQDEDGMNYNSGELISLLVIRQPHLQIELYHPITEVMVGELFAIPVEVINVGEETSNVSTMELRSLDLEIHDGAMYIGPLDPGTSGLLEAQAVAHQSGEAIAQVIIHYLDDFGHQQQVIQELRFQVRSPPTPVSAMAAEVSIPGPQPEVELSPVDKMVRFLKALLGLGV